MQVIVFLHTGNYATAWYNQTEHGPHRPNGRLNLACYGMFTEYIIS